MAQPKVKIVCKEIDKVRQNRDDQNYHKFINLCKYLRCVFSRRRKMKYAVDYTKRSTLPTLEVREEESPILLGSLGASVGN